MIDRVFDGSEVPLTCSFASPREGDEKASVIKISRAKAVLDTTTTFDEGQSVTMRLEFAAGSEIDIEGTVIDSGRNGLFLRWEHADPAAAAKLATLLVVNASLEKEKEGQGRKNAPPAKPVAKRAVPAAAPAGDPPEGGSVATLRSSLLRRSKTVRSEELARKQERWQVLDLSTVMALIEESVHETLKRSEHALNEGERKRLLEEAEDAFRDRLEAFKAEKAGLQAQTQNLSKQLEKAQSLLEEERLRVVSADRFTVSDVGLEELEKRLERILSRCLKKRKIPADAEEEMRAVVGKLLDDEREKIREKAVEAQSDAISLLERKVKRLAGALDEAHEERDHAECRARALEASGTINFANILQAGLADDDPDRVKKLDLLKEVVEVNRDVRQHMAAVEAKAASSNGEDVQGVKKIEVGKVAAPPLEVSS